MRQYAYWTPVGKAGPDQGLARPRANAEIFSTRSIAQTIAVPADFIGDVRSRLQLRAHGHLGECPVRLGLLISQELHRHDRTVASANRRPVIFPLTPAAAASHVLADRGQSQRHFLYRNYSPVSAVARRQHATTSWQPNARSAPVSEVRKVSAGEVPIPRLDAFAWPFASFRLTVQAGC
ncbi:hypothetical protein [Streptomyces alanosinicus]|uniref:Uncharacterized protein n=1 Tax=Streptomyces alanosinicus TaxID=68171 RepID=A0A918YRA6_9ACTN|nr:hypothetical protein GCM10010339_76210 [Streptomyces alanosinicus]